jgi:hypothetical protein
MLIKLKETATAVGSLKFEFDINFFSKDSTGTQKLENTEA